MSLIACGNLTAATLNLKPQPAKVEVEVEG
jgi:hypothetical protein